MQKDYQVILDAWTKRALPWTNVAEDTYETKALLLEKALFGAKREVTYEARIRFDIAEKRVFFWEMVKDSKKGFSFGIDKESYTQQGASLRRKVWSKQIDAKGNTYEFEFDLGEVSRSLKQWAKESQYSFKVIFKKEHI